MVPARRPSSVGGLGVGFRAAGGGVALGGLDGAGEEAVFGEGVGGDLPSCALEGGEEVFLAGSGVVEIPGDSGDGGARGEPGPDLFHLTVGGSGGAVLDLDLVHLGEAEVFNTEEGGQGCFEGEPAQIV